MNYPQSHSQTFYCTLNLPRTRNIPIKICTSTYTLYTTGFESGSDNARCAGSRSARAYDARIKRKGEGCPEAHNRSATDEHHGGREERADRRRVDASVALSRGPPHQQSHTFRGRLPPRLGVYERSLQFSGRPDARVA